MLRICRLQIMCGNKKKKKQSNSLNINHQMRQLSVQFKYFMLITQNVFYLQHIFSVHTFYSSTCSKRVQLQCSGCFRSIAATCPCFPARHTSNVLALDTTLQVSPQSEFTEIQVRIPREPDSQKIFRTHQIITIGDKSSSLFRLCDVVYHLA